ncbi:unnamed protein product, partial [Porites evermanni]
GATRALRLGERPSPQDSSKILRHTVLQIQSNPLCTNKTTISYNATITFCAGDGKGKSDTCQRDIFPFQTTWYSTPKNRPIHVHIAVPRFCGYLSRSRSGRGNGSGCGSDRSSYSDSGNDRGGRSGRAGAGGLSGSGSGSGSGSDSGNSGSGAVVVVVLLLVVLVVVVVVVVVVW